MFRRAAQMFLSSRLAVLLGCLLLAVCVVNSRRSHDGTTSDYMEEAETMAGIAHMPPEHHGVRMMKGSMPRPAAMNFAAASVMPAMDMDASMASGRGYAARPMLAKFESVGANDMTMGQRMQEDGGQASTGSAAPEDVSVSERMVIKRGVLSIYCRNVSQERDLAIAEIKEMGGWVESSQANGRDPSVIKYEPQRVGPDGRVGPGGGGGGVPPKPVADGSGGAITYVQLTVRVPAAKFDEGMGTLRRHAIWVGREEVTGQDVTEQFLDVSARAANLQAVRSQLEKLMSQANAVRDVLEVQRELTRITNDMEAQKSRAKYFTQFSSMSTITVDMNEHTDPQPPWKPPPQPPRLIRSIRHALQALQDSFFALANGAVFLIITILPITAVLAVAVLLVLRVALRPALAILRKHFPQQVESVIGMGTGVARSE